MGPQCSCCWGPKVIHPSARENLNTKERQQLESELSCCTGAWPGSPAVALSSADLPWVTCKAETPWAAPYLGSCSQETDTVCSLQMGRLPESQGLPLKPSRGSVQRALSAGLPWWGSSRPGKQLCVIDTCHRVWSPQGGHGAPGHGEVPAGPLRAGVPRVPGRWQRVPFLSGRRVTPVPRAEDAGL